MSEDRERSLEEALRSGKKPSDGEVASLLDQSEIVKSELQTPPPNAARERALFVQGVVGRQRAFLPLRFLVPAAVVVTGILAVAGFGRTALPGQTLSPVREALASVGLADTWQEDIGRRLEDTRSNLAEARTRGLGDPAAARALVLAAIGDLDRARRLSLELPSEVRAARLATIGRLEERAVEMLVRIEAGPEPEDEIRGEDDNSGPGGDDSGPGSDNSGPGGDDSGPGSDNSGPGGDDSRDDDNSGSGSDDSGGDDSSGSGGGDDSGGDDSSESGSDDSGGGDSSGSGSDDSGGDDDSSGSGGGDDSDDD